MDVLAVIPSANIVGNTSHAVRLPLRHSRARIRGPRLSRQRQGVLHETSESNGGIVAADPFPIHEYRSIVLSKRYGAESNVIEIISPVSADTNLPLIYFRDLLRKTIDELKSSDYLVISEEQSDWFAIIFDQLLAQNHIAAAATLSLQPKQFATSNGILIIPPQLNSCGGATTQDPSAHPDTESPINRADLQRKRCLNDLWTTQNLLKTTPLGSIKAEIHLIGDQLYSEILCFRVSFTPDPRLSDIGVVIDYASHHIKSLVSKCHQPLEVEDRLVKTIHHSILNLLLVNIAKELLIIRHGFWLDSATDVVGSWRQAIIETNDLTHPSRLSC